MNTLASPHAAQRTCAQCKSSKKKCDRLIPACGRCSRLSLGCSYPVIERESGVEPTSEPAQPRFEDIYQRLARIEARVFPASLSPSRSNTRERNSERLERTKSPDSKGSDAWQVNPGLLQPRHMAFVLYGSLVRALRENDTTYEAIGQKYFKYTHPWLPMVSRARFDEVVPTLDGFDGNDDYCILVLAMHLLISEPSPGATSESPRYRTCKYHFGQYATLKDPYIELIQAGMLIALFEHYQYLTDRANITLGICVRLAYALEIEEACTTQSGKGRGEMSMADEEAVLTWWGLKLLDRYFNMAPVAIPRQPAVPQKQSYNNTNNPDLPSGPTQASFTTIPTETLNNLVIEIEAAEEPAQVQAFIRHNRSQFSASFEAEACRLLKNINKTIVISRIRTQDTGDWAGMASILSAGLQLHCFYAVKDGLTEDKIIAIHSSIDQMRSILGRCRVFNGFTENYLEGGPPTWISISYQAICAYKLVMPAVSRNQLPEIDMYPFRELLGALKNRYRLAAACLALLEP